MTYDTKKVIFEKWKTALLDLCGFSNIKSLVDLGCRTGNFLIQIRKHYNDCHLMGIDSSKDMVDTAVIKAEKQYAHNIHFHIKDIWDFINEVSDIKYDIVSACHMLYYLKDIPTAIERIKQNLLKSNGIFFVTTNSMNNMPELYLLLRKVEREFKLEPKCSILNTRFGLENGYEILKRHYKYVDYHSIESELIVEDFEQVMDYIVSRFVVVMPHLPDTKYKQAIDFLKPLVKERIEQKGNFVITRKVGALLCSD